MKKEKKAALIVENCPILCEKYIDVLNSLHKEEKTYSIFTAHNYEIGEEILNKTINTNLFLDFVILDLKLPSAKEKKIFPGIDFGVLVRKVSPKTKVITLSSCSDNYILHNVLRTLNPECFLIKSDLTSTNFESALNSVHNNLPYYSQTILKLLRKGFSNNFQLDSIDRQILYELSIGSRTKDLPNHIPLSVGSIEKRKRQLRTILEVNDKGERELILKAKKRGFL